MANNIIKYEKDLIYWLNLIVRLFLNVVGWFLLILSLAIFIVSLLKGVDGITIGMVLFCLVPGALFTFIGHKMNKSARNKKYIDDSNREIILPRFNNYRQPENPYGNIEAKQLTCRSCGAVVNVAPGSTGKCEYCGSQMIPG